MSWLARLRRRRDLERELDAELRDHVERRTADFVRAGDSPAVARRRAAAEFGGLEPISEQCRDVRGWRWMDDLVQDVQYAGRGLRAHPVVSAAIVLSLALGIGANTAVFTVLYATLLRPLPVDDPQTLVQFVPYTASGDQSSHLSYPLFRELSAATSPDIDVFAVAGPKMPRLKIGGGFPERAVVEDVSWNYFRALRVPPAAGRVLQEGDDATSGGSAVAVLSHSFWERRFDANADAIGRTIEIDGKPFVVVGVAAGGFDGIEAESRTEIWLPITSRLQPAWLSMTGSMTMRLMGRLTPAADRQQLEAAADVAYRRHLAEHFLKGVPPTAKSVWRNRSIRLRSAGAGLSSLGLGYRRPLLILMSAVAIILVLACANVANLLLARQRAREREFAVRLSLGAGRSRLARQLLTESVFLAAIGALGGVLFAWWGARALIGLLPQPAVAFAFDLSPSPATLLFSTAVAMASAVTVGAVPALRAAGTPSMALIRTSRTLLHLRFGRSLVILQIAGSLTLLVAAGLMVRTLQNLKATDLGFVPDDVATFDLSFPAGFPAPAKAPLYSRIVDRLESMPGARGATYSQESVYNVGGWSGKASGPAAEDVPAEVRDVALLRVGPRFFEVLGLRLLTGRTFAPGDHDGQPRSIVVNETFARHFFKSASPIGRRIGLNKSEFEIVGVVRDALHYGAREQPCGGRVAYFPIDLSAPGGAFFVRGSVPVADIGRIAAEEARHADSEILLTRLRLLNLDVETLIAQERLVGVLASAFAILALSLAAVGLYGIMSYGVTQRTGEIGVRAALGASPGLLRRMVLADTCRLVIAGLALGGIAAFFGTRLVTSLLFGVEPADPVTMAVAPVTLAFVAIGAAYLPARRAARIDPAVALRLD